MSFPSEGDKSTLSDSGISVSCNITLAPETFKYILKTNLPRGVKWDISSPPTAQSWLESFSQMPPRDSSSGCSLGPSNLFFSFFLWHFVLARHQPCQILWRIFHLDFLFFFFTQTNVAFCCYVLKENLLWMGNVICMLPKFRQDLTQAWRRGTHLPLFLDL